ncbi:hypothetical protein C4544_07380 [candidate division WS5 bacterium]|uniref:Uncharacterized protein n=1 Tax=candidate division WS5 bacterium TaxID=2093353 RepID=A0A419D9X5_9BACT|nr:MAG: hypothetical protein C4544_07380 [candidate division WS5 bacterium]
MKTGGRCFKRLLKNYKWGIIGYFFITESNIYVFFLSFGKFWRYLSENSAHLPPTIINSLILNYNYWRQIWRQIGGSWRQMGGRKPVIQFSAAKK